MGYPKSQPKAQYLVKIHLFIKNLKKRKIKKKKKKKFQLALTTAN